jgi:hypothetical protein
MAQEYAPPTYPTVEHVDVIVGAVGELTAMR